MTFMRGLRCSCFKMAVNLGDSSEQGVEKEGSPGQSHPLSRWGKESPLPLTLLKRWQRDRNAALQGMEPGDSCWTPAFIVP